MCGSVLAVDVGELIPGELEVLAQAVDLLVRRLASSGFVEERFLGSAFRDDRLAELGAGGLRGCQRAREVGGRRGCVRSLGIALAA